MRNKKLLPDGRPTMSEWPVRIWNVDEIPPQYADVRLWLKSSFSEYDFVYAPKRNSNSQSYGYLFGYGNDEIIFCRKEPDEAAASPIQPIVIKRCQLTEVKTERELLNAKVILHYTDKEQQNKLEFPYVPSVYYLYDPFLNWLLGLEKEFLPTLAEQEHPRPDQLYHESLAMFNYSLGAYRLGNGFQEYQYEAKQHRCKWMPWKKTMEEWLKIPMERGVFKLHSFGYLTECAYCMR